MPDDYVPVADNAVGNAPVVFRPATFDRHARVVDLVEGNTRARYPRKARGRTTHAASGTWGYLASGNTITAASGMVLGDGTVTLCSRVDGTLTADGEDVPVLNSGGAIAGPRVLALEWTAGAWSVCECGGCAVDC